MVGLDGPNLHVFFRKSTAVPLTSVMTNFNMLEWSPLAFC